MRYLNLFTLSLLCLFIFSCQENEKSDYTLGKIELKVTGNEEARTHFHKGLLLLHSFEYEDARNAFIQARKADPKMPMAYWGEAMTFNHSLWGEQDYEKASEVLKDLKENAPLDDISPIEKELIAAVEILFAPNESKAERDKNYANYMSIAHDKFKDNHEVASFYALSLLGSVQDGRDDEIYEKGAVIANGILKENPNHPGALHYLIHSYDDPIHAQLALDAAFSYGKVAPDASHALHMPSHIFVALGMWNEVIEVNERSYQASVNRMNQLNLDNDARGYHAYHWLEYGYLQNGRADDAKLLLMDMENYVQEKPSIRARYHLIFLKGTYLMETNQWQDPVADIDVELSDINVAIRAQYHFIDGMKAFKEGDIKTLESKINTIKKDYENEKVRLDLKDITVCSNASRNEASESDINDAKIMEFELRAMKAWLESDDEATENWLQASIELNDTQDFSYGPPFIQKPVHELYGEWLAEKGRYSDAIAQYEKSLQRGPKRRLALEAINSLKEKNEQSI